MPAPRDHEAIMADLIARGLGYIITDKKTNQKKTAVRWPGTLDLAHARGLYATETEILQMPLSTNGERAVVRATVHFERDGIKMHFMGIGTCAPGNQGQVGGMYPLELAETRSLTRAMKQGINIGDLSYADELPDDADDGPQARPEPQAPRPQQPPRHVDRDTGVVTDAPPVADAKQRDQLTRLRKLAGNAVAVPEAIPAVTCANEITALAGRAAGKAARDALASAAQTLKAQTGIDRSRDVSQDAMTLAQVDSRLQSFRAAYAQHQRAAQAPEEQLDPVPA